MPKNSPIRAKTLETTSFKEDKMIPIDILIDRERELEKFIYATWLRNYKSSYAARGIQGAVYFPYQSLRIERVLHSPKTTILKACNKEDHSQSFGYSIFENEVGSQIFVHHFTFVKSEFRRMGIAKMLLEKTKELVPFEKTPIKYYSHHNCNEKNKWVATLLEEKWHCIYNPYVA